MLQLFDTFDIFLYMYLYKCLYYFFPEKDVLAKIRSLRTYYSKQLGKVQNGIKSGATRNDIYISKWAHFSSVAFLRDMVTPRKSVTLMVSLSFVLLCLSLIFSEGWGYGNLDKFLRLREERSKLFLYTNYWK